MDHFENSLLALRRLLDQTAVQEWAERVGKDLERWRKDRDISHYLSSYGGMGSFTDLIICEGNGHQVTAELEPWANTLLRYL